MSPFLLTIANILALAWASIAFISLIQLFHQKHPPLPPGPTSIPLIGNLLIVPQKRLHLKYTEWAKTYSDVFRLKVMNNTIIVINTPTLVHKVFDLKSVSSSNRPKSIIAGMIAPNNVHMATGRYANDTWKSSRKEAAYALSPESVKTRSAYQYAEVTQLMNDLLHSPELRFDHLRRYTLSFSLGPTLQSPDIADFMNVHPRYVEALEMGTLPPVDLFPFLALVPKRWAKWKQTVEHIRHLQHSLSTIVFSVMLNIGLQRKRAREEHSWNMRYIMHPSWG
ncbi:hypothetical protein GYMLUDRAFT_48339 [Collybiopsis luxurians FD-317 M1]|uniref:Cytochrome P450 n=1 Tax=Collybiopsis luxurians FD-317 M1 TaxID=944289 RepID=A0A0D0BYM1_9AGAR|nr:hypothetical protein GYMLUDRAFT_48339 [Collybiopsis luxurians FD-317 M1]